MEKQHILDEIKRTAAINGGAALGHRKFFTETGIREADWKGKYWARWGDAVREAGLQANQKRLAFDDDLLIEKFISLVRELRRFPVVSEMRMKVRTDPSFPNDKTFSRFGSKQQFAARILNYCKGRAGYDDIAALCATVPEDRPSLRSGDVASEVAFGFVYLIKSGRHYKIGRSVSVGQRERQLAIQLPDKASTVHSVRTDDPIGIEAYWHKRFESKRKNGEWFDLDNQDVSAFKRRKYM